MTAKILFVVCAQILVVQYAFSQCLNPGTLDASRYAPYGQGGCNWGFNLPYDGLSPLTGRGRGYDGFGSPAIEFTPSSGGNLIVTSGSALPPVGVSLASENVYEGVLTAAGELPFVGTVGVDGLVPTAGAGAVDYGCGTGETAMESVADILTPGIGAVRLGYRGDWPGRGGGFGF